jgi:hypothetical protein
MIALDHFPHDPRELVKLNRFLRVQRMLLEEWHDDFCEVFQVSHPPAVTIAMVAADNAAAHARSQPMEKTDVSLVLHDCQFGQYLITEALVLVLADAHMETTFAIDKADDPVGVECCITPGTLNVWSLRGHWISPWTSLRIVPMCAAFLLLRIGGRKRDACATHSSE